MPVDAGVVDAVAAAVADVYREAETALVAQISRRLAAGLDATDWAERKLREVKALRRAAQLIVDELDRRAPPAVRAAIAAGYRAGNAAAVTDLAEAHIGDPGPAARGADTRRGSAIQALADAAVRELRPLHLSILPATERAFRDAVAGATARRLAGVTDLRTAAQSAWAALVDHGITGFTDTTGRRWQLSTYVEMAVRTGVTRAVVAGQIDEWAARGVRQCYVVDNPRECPLCLPWEGKVLQHTGRLAAPAVATLDAAREAGLLHPNCRHQLRPWARGVRIVAARRPDPGGYAAEQRQRELERHVRRWRGREAAALDPAAERYAARRVAAWDGELTAHLAAHPRLPRRSYREHPGAGFTAPPSRRADRASLSP